MRPAKPAAAALMLVLLLAVPHPAASQEQAGLAEDAILRAMQQEIARTRRLRLAGLDEPYFVQYSLDDAWMYSMSATLGAVMDESDRHVRLPGVMVRVGDYSFDNTNHVFSDLSAVGSTRGIPLPLDNDTLALRTFFWLATDRGYKGAVEAISRKRSALRNITIADDLPDFSRAEPVRLVLDGEPRPFDKEAWKQTARNLSAIFAAHPSVLDSDVRFELVQYIHHMANSEGTLIREPDSLAYVRVRAQGQSSDGMTVGDATVVQARDLGGLPREEDLAGEARLVAEHVDALSAAPIGEVYVGPVLFDGIASAQLIGQLLGPELALSRRPASSPGRPAPFTASQLERRLGARILPEWMDVVDDPTQTEWRGQPLFGHYVVDIEGVRPQPLTLVEDGILKAFLLTRQPVRGQEESNGRARLAGRYGANAATFGNLFVRASEASPAAALRRQLLEMCEQQGKPYGIIIRKLDFPASAASEEIRSAARASRRGDTTDLVSTPILAYRVYTDGREELVRGLRFRGVTVRALRDIVAASEELYRFDFLANTAPLSMMGASSDVSTNTVVAPSVLFDDMELEPDEGELPTLPIVPPPELTAAR